MLKVFGRVGHVAALLYLLAFMSSSAFAQSATNPQSLAFTPSADHYATSGSGEPAVTQYNLEIYEVGASQPKKCEYSSDRIGVAHTGILIAAGLTMPSARHSGVLTMT